MHDNGKILDANRTLATMVGYELSELIGMEAPRLVAPEWRDFTLQKRLAGCEEPYEAVALRKDGSTFLAELRGRAIPYDGRTVRVVAIRDVTQRKRAEEALRQAEARYRRLFEQAPAIYVITRNDEGAPIISDCNELFLATLGHPRAEVLGQPLAEFYTPESCVQLLGHGGYQRALEGRFGVEARQLLTRDGRVVETVLRAVPELDDGGRTIGTRAMYLNITQRKRAEEALRESEKKFRHVLEGARDVVYCLNLKTFTYDYVSPSCSEVLGYGPEEFAALGFMGAGSLVHPDDVQRVLENFAQVRTRPNVEYRFRHKELGYRWLSDSRSVVFDDNGGAAVVGALRDITDHKRAEEALLYQAQLLASVNDAVISTDEQFVLKSWNPAAERIYGWKAEEVIGRPAQGVLRTEFPGSERSAVIEAAAETGNFYGEVVQYRKDGAPIHMESKVIALRDGCGRTTGYVGVNRDISARKRAEEALRESEERFRRLCDATTEGIAIHDEGTVVDGNQALAAMLGYDVSEIIGRQGLEFVAPGYRGLVEQNIVSGYEAPYEALCLRRDGSVFPVEVRGKVISHDGRTARVTAVRDITVRKRAEEALRESEERFRLIARATSDAIYDYDLVTGSVWWSEGMRTLFGYARNDVGPGITWWYDHIHSEDRDGVASRTYAATLNRGQFWVEEYRFRRSDGSYAYVADRGYFIYDGVGKPLRVIGGLTDITERKRAEEALRESEERFRLIARTTSDVIWDWDLGTGRVWRSEGMQTLFGHAPSEEGPRVTWWYERVHPEDRERSNSGFYATISGGGESWTSEYRFRRVDGSYAHVQQRDYIIRDGDGKPVRLIGGMADISERKRAEEALRESEERFRFIAQATSDAIYDCALVTGGVWWSEGVRTLFGYATGDVGPDIDWWYDHIHPEDRDGVASRTYAAAAGGEELWVEEYRFRRADGSYAYVFDRGYLVYDQARKPLRMIGGITDITERKRAEEALRQAEARYRLLFEQAPAMYVITRNEDSAPIISDCNELFLATLGHPRSEVLGRPLADFYTPQSRAQLLVHGGYQRALEGRFMVQGRQLVPRDGHTVETMLRAVPELDADGRTIGTRAMYVDITESKRAEEALRESESRYRLLAENATDMIWTVDTNLRFTYVSPSVARIRGYTVAEVMAQTPEEVLTPPSLELAGRAFAEELAAESTGRSDLSRSRTLELEHICKDGSTVWAEVRMTALRDETGGIAEILGVSRDISERRRAQTALEESEKRYRLLAENATDIIWIRDLNLRVLYINPAVTRIRGYSIEEVMAHSLEETLTPASLGVARRALAEALEEIGRAGLPRWWTLELEHTCKDGSTVWLETTATGLRDEQGRVVQVLGASRDISERKREEEALQEAREDLECRVERRMRRGNAYGLTFRELTVLHLVVAGKSDKEIASVLGISTLTASKHLTNILHKMGAASRTEAGVRAVREGLLD